MKCRMPVIVTFECQYMSPGGENNENGLPYDHGFSKYKTGQTYNLARAISPAWKQSKVCHFWNTEKV